MHIGLETTWDSELMDHHKLDIVFEGPYLLDSSAVGWRFVLVIQKPMPPGSPAMALELHCFLPLFCCTNKFSYSLY